MISFDPQAIGWVDDGSEGGAIKRLYNEFMIVPFDTEPTSESSGQLFNNFYNAFGGRAYGNGAVLMLGHNTTPGAYIRRSFTFRGTMLGLCMASFANSVPIPEYTVLIDGVAYPCGDCDAVKKTPVRWDNPSLVLQDMTYMEVIATNLSDTVHQASIIYLSNLTIATGMSIYGIGVSRAAGYKEPPTSVWRLGKTALTTVPTAISSNTSLLIKAISKFIFYNSTEAAVAVTVSYSNNEPVFVKSVAALSTEEWVFPDLFAIDTALYYVSASAESAVTMTVIGRV